MILSFGARDRSSPHTKGTKQRDWRKREQLGLPIGTATHRLRKMILFNLIQETNRDRCIRCKSRIYRVEDLAIDHESAWLDVSPDLFWDLRNIGFSHTRCNAQFRRTVSGRRFGPSPARMVGKPGTAWCSSHKSFSPVALFNLNRTRWNGLQDSCRECSAKLRLQQKRHLKEKRIAAGQKRQSSIPRRVGPTGTAWCSGHQRFLPTVEFGSSRTKWNGLQSQCRACNVASLRRRRSKH